MLLSGKVCGTELTSLAKQISFAKKTNQTNPKQNNCRVFRLYLRTSAAASGAPSVRGGGGREAGGMDAGGTDAGGMRSIGSPAGGADPHCPLAPAPSARRMGLEAQQHHGREPASLRPKVGLLRLLPNGISYQMNPAAAFDEKHLSPPPRRLTQQLTPAQPIE